MGRTQRAVIPPFLLERIATAKRLAAAQTAARNTLLTQEPGRRARINASGQRAAPTAPEPARNALTRAVYDAEGTETLPGTLVRGEGDPASDDAAVNEAYEGLGQTYALYDEVYGRASIDGQGMPLHASVHYGQDYDNAFWDGIRMVFGDGDGEVFKRFTVSLSIIGHELTHGVSEHSAALRYQGQSGALNESVSDVFGCLVEQRAKNQSAAEASWLVGEGLFTDQVQGTALRSLKAPGTAYDDDVLGKDPQPATMADYVETTEDEGGVHINSGIPNHAFYLVATALGGAAWERAGAIWYQALTSGALGHDASFTEFAQTTIASAHANFGSDVVDAVRRAWQTVQVIEGSATGAPSPQTVEDAAKATTIVVERSGGVAAITRTWRVDIDTAPDADELRRLIRSVDWLPSSSPNIAGPDRFEYRIRCTSADHSVDVLETTRAEAELTPEWHELLARIRESGRS